MCMCVCIHTHQAKISACDQIIQELERAYINTHIHTYKQTNTHTYTRPRSPRASDHPGAGASIHEYTYPYIHTHIHTHIHTPGQDIRARSDHPGAGASIHTYIHTNIQTNAHTYTRPRSPRAIRSSRSWSKHTTRTRHLQARLTHTKNNQIKTVHPQ